MLDERCDADDRVVTPVVRFPELPEVQPGGKQRTVDAGRELLHAGIQRVAAGRTRCRLDDAGAGIGFHQPHQRGQAIAAHDAVRVQHHHIAVVGAPATTEVGNVAALAFDPVLAPAVEHAAEAAHRTAQCQPRVAFCDAIVRIAAVAQDEEVEVAQFPGARQRFIGRAQTCKNACHVFVADRHDDRGARLPVYGCIPCRRSRYRVTVAGDKLHQEAHHRGPESGRNPAEQNREQHQDHDFQRLRAVIRQHGGHEVGRENSLRQHQQSQYDTAYRPGTMPASARIGRIRATIRMRTTPRRPDLPEFRRPAPRNHR